MVLGSSGVRGCRGRWSSTSRSAGGMQPVSWLLPSRKFRRSSRLPSSDGMVPVSRLTLSHRYSRLVRFPRSDGMEPDSRLTERVSLRRLLRSPSAAGISPLSRFLSSQSTSKLDSPPSSRGTAPVSRLSLRIRVCRSGEAAQFGRDGAGELVDVEPQMLQTVEPSQVRWYGAGEAFGCQKHFGDPAGRTLHSHAVPARDRGVLAPVQRCRASERVLGREQVDAVALQGGVSAWIRHDRPVRAVGYLADAQHQLVAVVPRLRRHGPAESVVGGVRGRVGDFQRQGHRAVEGDEVHDVVR